MFGGYYSLNTVHRFSLTSKANCPFKIFAAFYRPDKSNGLCWTDFQIIRDSAKRPLSSQWNSTGRRSWAEREREREREFTYRSNANQSQEGSLIAVEAMLDQSAVCWASLWSNLEKFSLRTNFQALLAARHFGSVRSRSLISIDAKQIKWEKLQSWLKLNIGWN